MTARLSALAAALFAAAAAAQTPQSTITRALEPAAEDLARLNLVSNWRLYLPTEGRGDMVVSVQPAGDQVFAQLRSGKIIAIQADNNPRTFRRAGDVLWSYRPQRPPGPVQPLAVGPDEVYAAHGQDLLILDRADGKVKYHEELPSVAAAGPAADSFAVYIPLDNRRIVAYSHVDKVPGYRAPRPYEAPDPVSRLTLAPAAADALSTPQQRSPSIAPLETVRPPFRRNVDTIDSSPSIQNLRNLRPPYREVNVTRSPSVITLRTLRNVYELTDKNEPTRIKYLWQMLVDGRLTDPPLLTYDPTDPTSERLVGYTGREVFTALRHSERINAVSTRYVTPAAVTAPLTNHGDFLYVPTADNDLASFSLAELREPSLAANTLLRGKFTTGGPVEQKPVLVEDSLYAVGSRWGLIRLKHGTLDPMWNERLPDGRVQPRPNPEVVRVLAVNSSYVYALSERGRLLVIDAARGSTLSSYDVSAFTFPVTNDLNDRVYLASNNGLLVCMRDRLRVLPEVTRKPPPEPKRNAVGEVEAMPEPAPAPKKEPEKKD